MVKFNKIKAGSTFLAMVGFSSILMVLEPTFIPNRLTTGFIWLNLTILGTIIGGYLE